MKTLEVKLDRSYYQKIGIVTAMVGGLGLALLFTGISNGLLPMILFSVFMMGLWGYFAVREYWRGAKTLDEEGVTRRDGRRFLWSDVQKIKLIHMPSKTGQGTLNHAELHFPQGQVRIFPRVLENGWEAIFWAKRMQAKQKATQASSPPTASTDSASHNPFEECRICWQLSDYLVGRQKHGREEEDIFLPAAAASLQTLFEIEPGQTRSPSLQQCPECETYYLYEIEYEYLATGSEDEQKLTRLTVADAATYLELRGS